ncbi:hypothetical protein TSA1_10260 [Bradyrhizobium nitroreducens]|uniref:4Fe4S-binding SPASM domain-containing protein n=2 Tax=Bradyrhizobium nitroreducens TaxID=709803 RepID=A0A2M6U942_9BRAD|nr:hypothetical protein TSA1_10260 [Bradyrhizobium nitroreducens]
MSLATAERIAEGLAEINFGYRGQISVSGFGEPLLNDDIVEIIAKLRRHLPGVYIELICNGDFLSVELIRSLLNRGVNTILVNLYDGAHQIADFEERFRGIPPARYILRHHYLGAEDSYGLTLNNRTGLVGIRGPLAKPAERACYVPFYKMMIDWNGNHLLCFNDWGRRASVAGNVNEQSIRELWLSPSMEAYRRELLEERRSLTPCNTCDVIGTLHGKASYDAFKEYYE